MSGVLWEVNGMQWAGKKPINFLPMSGVLWEVKWDLRMVCPSTGSRWLLFVYTQRHSLRHSRKAKGFPADPW